MKTSIFLTLKKLGLTSEESRVLFNDRTRDVENVKVWKDVKSGVIYVDDFYTGDETYIDGSYRDQNSNNLTAGRLDLWSYADAQRRFKANLKFVAAKKILDFGCGSGDFLKLVQPFCVDVIGVELQQNYIDELNDNGIPCTNNLDDIANHSLDRAVSFHVIEHLPNPLCTLSEVIRKLVSGGQILIEVPHAHDFLLSTVNCEEFKQFTLWSQHLVLHTRESLYRILEALGLEDIQIEGVQRYPLSNHLNWIINGKPGGHQSPLSSLDSDALHDAYRNSLARINATDTLVATAKTP